MSSSGNQEILSLNGSMNGGDDGKKDVEMEEMSNIEKGDDELNDDDLENSGEDEGNVTEKGDAEEGGEAKDKRYWYRGEIMSLVDVSYLKLILNKIGCFQGIDGK